MQSRSVSGPGASLRQRSGRVIVSRANHHNRMSWVPNIEAMASAVRLWLRGGSWSNLRVYERLGVAEVNATTTDDLVW